MCSGGLFSPYLLSFLNGGPDQVTKGSTTLPFNPSSMWPINHYSKLKGSWSRPSAVMEVKHIALDINEELGFSHSHLNCPYCHYFYYCGLDPVIVPFHGKAFHGSLLPSPHYTPNLLCITSLYPIRFSIFFFY